MKKKIAIIGANDSILPLILKAKEKGYETHVFAWKCGDKGEKAADVFYPVSIAEKEKIGELCEQIGVCAVASITSDFAVSTVNYIVRKLGLVGNSEKTDVFARNKYQMRCALKDAGLYTPKFFAADVNFSRSYIENFLYPIIVKPTDRWSSKGVTRVDNPDALIDAVKYAIDESYEKKAIIEEFMDGPEYSAECICYHGDYRILAFTQKMTTGCPHYIETGHIQPADISPNKKNEIASVITRALTALDIKNGAAHAEFRILGNGQIGIIEIGARMGGDCIGTDLTPISTGMDYVGMVVDIASGKAPDFSIVTQPSAVQIKFIIDELDLYEYKALKANRSANIVKEGEFNFDFTQKVKDSSTRHGFYIVKDI